MAGGCATVVGGGGATVVGVDGCVSGYHRAPAAYRSRHAPCLMLSHTLFSCACSVMYSMTGLYLAAGNFFFFFAIVVLMDIYFR